jgi:hypothetical protein
MHLGTTAPHHHQALQTLSALRAQQQQQRHLNHPSPALG